MGNATKITLVVDTIEAQHIIDLLKKQVEEGGNFTSVKRVFDIIERIDKLLTEAGVIKEDDLPF